MEDDVELVFCDGEENQKKSGFRHRNEVARNQFSSFLCLAPEKQGYGNCLRSMWFMRCKSTENLCFVSSVKITN